MEIYSITTLEKEWVPYRVESVRCLWYRQMIITNDTGEETFGLLCFAEITEFAKELHSEMEKVVLMDELPENWTYPLIQPKLIEKYLQVKIIL